jgi:PadR family transcriptional regulator PadR
LAAGHHHHHHKKKIQARPKNWIMPVALVILQNEPSHGYRLMERFEEFGFEPTNAGTFYRTLRQLEEKGLCKSEWNEDPVGVRPRRMYSITDAGEEYLAAWAKEIKSYQQVMDGFFQTYNNKGVSS